MDPAWALASQRFFEPNASAGSFEGWGKTEPVALFVFSAFAFFGFFGSRPDRICPLAMAASLAVRVVSPSV
jgi:hypothetical protein